MLGVGGEKEEKREKEKEKKKKKGMVFGENFFFLHLVIEKKRIIERVYS